MMNMLNGGLLCLLILLTFSNYVNSEPGRGNRNSKEEKRLFNPENENNRNERLFSLFNVVQFKNDPCSSTSSLSSASGVAFRNGTCYTTNECAALGGSGFGPCASGFGVCCVFFTSKCGDTVSQNCSYVRNPGFPTAYTDNTACQFTINKCAEDVCALRLDFPAFSILGPATTDETDNNRACRDTFSVTGLNSGQIVPVICGKATAQHMYIDLGAQDTDSASLAFTFSGTAARNWEIKVTQIKCSSDVLYQKGCLQYHTGIDGRFTTFNFEDTMSAHLSNQDYQICVRRELGFCCIAYSVCSDANSMTLSSGGTAMKDKTFAKGFVESLCDLDYITIEGSSTSPMSRANLQQRYCGGKLTTIPAGLANQIIYDCTPPFEVGIFTDDVKEPEPLTMPARGVCLEYSQVPCSF